MTPWHVTQHESRHAVMAWHFGIPIIEAAVAPDGRSGYVVTESPPMATASAAALHAGVLLSLAGVSGDTPETLTCAGTDDVEAAQQWYAAWQRRSGVLRPFHAALSAYVDECRAILVEYPNELSAVRDGLLQHGSLSGTALERLLIGGALPRPALRPQVGGSAALRAGGRPAPPLLPRADDDTTPRCGNPFGLHRRGARLPAYTAWRDVGTRRYRVCAACFGHARVG